MTAATAALPPGPTSPAIVQLATWLRDPLGFLETMRARYGPIFTMRQPAAPLVVVSGAEATETLFSDRRFGLPGDTELRSLLGDRAVLLLSGREHKERRRILMPPFAGGALLAWAEAIQAMTVECMASASAPNGPINVRNLMQEITLNVMLQIVFGAHEGERRQKLRRDVTDRMLLSSRPAALLALWASPLQTRAWPAWRRTLDSQAACDEAFFAEIEDARRARRDEPTILGILLDATDEEHNPLPDCDVRDELMTMMVAGHENTATALSWALYWVNAHPEVAARLRDEIEELGDDPDPVEIARLPYLEAVCCETMRIFPPVMMTLCRVPEETVEIGGHVLPPQVMVRSSIYLTHRDPEVYPDPARFDPDRFLDPPKHKFAFQPFGGGGRRCIGGRFAMFEMKIILAELVRGWDVALPAKPLRAVRRTGLLAPDIGFSVRVRERPMSSASKARLEEQPQCAA